MSLLAAGRGLRRTASAATPAALPCSLRASTIAAPAARASVTAAPTSAAACASRRLLWGPAKSKADAPWKQYHKPLSLQRIQPEVTRTVPEGIMRPPYVRPGFNDDPRHSQHRLVGIEIKDAASIAGMRESCRAASLIRAYAGSLVRPGITTDEIDAAVHAEVVRRGWYPSPLGYAGFPKSICTSVNQAVVHGIPDGRVLLEGDMLNIDVSVYVQGFHGDCSGMFVAGKADPLAQRLIDTTREALQGAIALCKPGVPFNAVGAFIAPLAASRGYSVVRQFCGHGIGSIFHMPPLVFHCVNDVRDRMQPGMTFTIEPLLNEGAEDIEIMDDGWTFQTKDGGRSAQFEDTILITETGHEILTKHE